MSEGWDDRAMCPDGGCIGVLGPDGTCKVCGKAGDVPARAAAAPDDEDADEDDEDDEDDDEYEDDDGDEDDDNGLDAPHADAAGATPSAYDWNTRTLCPDGACLGVIGANGKCNMCGTKAEGAA